MPPRERQNCRAAVAPPTLRNGDRVLYRDRESGYDASEAERYQIYLAIQN